MHNHWSTNTAGFAGCRRLRQRMALLVLAVLVSVVGHLPGVDAQSSRPPDDMLIATDFRTIPTYDYEAALVPTTPDDPIYPYQRLDPGRVGPPQPRTYEVLVVENRWLELTFLPALGGRLYQVLDKASGQPLFYQNPVIKPSPFGQRGWWLGVGGMEWAVPTEEHGYLEHLPWDTTWSIEGQSVVVRASTTEQQTGMRVTASVTLPSEERRIGVRLDVQNPTQESHPLQMWINGLLAPGGSNRIGADLRFVVPAEQMLVHAAQDSGVPPPQMLMPWPLLAERDMQYPANWDGYVGAFAPHQVPFFGVYDSGQDVGMAVIQQEGAAGAKFFGMSENFDRSLFTDDGSDYVELWSGAQRSFWDYPPIAPGATRSVQTTWLPLHGLGRLLAASADGALGLVQQDASSSQLALLAARRMDVSAVVVRVNGQEVLRSGPLTLQPERPEVLTLPVNAADQQITVEAGELRLQTPAPAARCFEETSYCIGGRIRDYWEQNGGLPVFGFPISEQRVFTIEGQSIEAQWFERNRLELHPQNAPPYDVLLGRLGADVLIQQGREWQAFPTDDAQQAGCRYFAATKQNICGDIRAAWEADGLDLGDPGISERESLALFGLPIGPLQEEEIEGQTYQVQWFERARFELHPENDPPYHVLLGLLGRESVDNR